ncbi:GNAT family N-acetyltransferase [Candidatus Saccharibacteria bacterium]|nr:GNAT family N-acetyltransferase [Candidatus Saccharibacteria bacterium]
MKFDVIGFEDKKKWERIVKDREVYYQWQYVDAFYKIGDGIPKLAYAFDRDDYVINVFFLRNINRDLNFSDSLEQCYDIITPYGYGGVDYNGNNTLLLNYYFDQFDQYCNENNIISEFVRLSPFTKNYTNYDSRYELSTTSKTVFMKLDNPRQIWDDMEGRSRTTIRKAIKNGLEVKSGFSRQMLDEFKIIYHDTMDRDNAEENYYFNDDFFKSIYENLKDFSKIYTVYYENKPISSSIVMFNKENAHYHLSGTLSDYMKYGANNIGLYKIALDLCDGGYKIFHLGGGYGGDSSPLLKFKESFNKNGLLDFYVAKRVFNQKIYDNLCSKVGVKKDCNYFPAYRKPSS